MKTVANLVKKLGVLLFGVLAISMSIIAFPSEASAKSTEALVNERGAAPFSLGSDKATRFAACSDERITPQDYSQYVDGSGKPLIPIERWSDAAGSTHTRLGGKVIDDVDNKIARNLIGSNLFRLGNTWWNVGVSMVQASAHFELLCNMATVMDKAAGTIGVGLTVGGSTGGSIVMLMIISAVVYAIWKKRTGEDRQFRSLGGSFVALIVFFLMTQGAQTTTDPGTTFTNKDTVGGVVIGKFSPAWFALNIDSSVSYLANAPTNAMSSAMDDLANVSTAKGEISRAGSVAPGSLCAAYKNNLKKEYVTKYPQGGSLAVALSSIWEESGLDAWRVYQFGGDNVSGLDTYCLLLEHFAGVRSDVIAQRVQQVVPGSPLNTGSFEWNDDKEEDRAIIYLAICGWGPNAVPNRDSSTGINAEWNWVESSTGSSEKYFSEEGKAECDTWYKSSNADLGEKSKTEFIDSAGHISDRTDGKTSSWALGTDSIDASHIPYQARSFLYNWHGDSYGSGTSVAMAYVFTATILLFVFGTLSLAVIVAKVVTAAAVPMVMFAIVAAIWPGKQDNAKVAKFFKFYTGMVVYTFGISLVLSLVAMFTRFLVYAGSANFDNGSIIHVVWIGLSPLLAIMGVHIMFKASGLPSPFSPTAAVGMAAALAGGGAFVGAGLATAAHRAKYAGKRAKYEAQNAGRRMRTNGPSRRRGPNVATNNQATGVDGSGRRVNGSTGASTGGALASAVGGAVGGAAGGSAVKPGSWDRPDEGLSTKKSGERRSVSGHYGRRAMAPVVGGARGTDKRKRRMLGTAAAGVGAGLALATGGGVLLTAGVAYGAARATGAIGNKATQSVKNSRPGQAVSRGWADIRNSRSDGQLAANGATPQGGSLPAPGVTVSSSGARPVSMPGRANTATGATSSSDSGGVANSSGTGSTGTSSVASSPGNKSVTRAREINHSQTNPSTQQTRDMDLSALNTSGSTFSESTNRSIRNATSAVGSSRDSRLPPPPGGAAPVHTNNPQQSRRRAVVPNRRPSSGGNG